MKFCKRTLSSMKYLKPKTNAKSMVTCSSFVSPNAFCSVLGPTVIFLIMHRPFLLFCLPLLYHCHHFPSRAGQLKSRKRKIQNLQFLILLAPKPIIPSGRPLQPWCCPSSTSHHFRCWLNQEQKVHFNYIKIDFAQNAQPYSKEKPITVDNATYALRTTIIIVPGRQNVLEEVI